MRIVTALTVRGRVGGFPTMAGGDDDDDARGMDATLRFCVLGDRSVVGAIEAHDSPTVDAFVRHCVLVAAQDGAPEDWLHFQIVQCRGDVATSVDYCGRLLAGGGGLVGSWTRVSDAPNRPTTRGGRFRLEPVAEAHSRDVSEASDSESEDDPPIVHRQFGLTPHEAAAPATPPRLSPLLGTLEPGTYIFHGQDRDRLGLLHGTNAQLLLELSEGGRVVGELYRAREKIPIEGAWTTTADPTTTIHLTTGEGETYAGSSIIHEDAKCLIGTWDQATGDDTPTRASQFVLKRHVPGQSEPDESPLTVGTYHFSGMAASDSGSIFASTLELVLEADGTLVGRSCERSTRPQECDVHGSWRGRCVEYTMMYSSGFAAFYHYVGHVSHAGVLVGGWTNANMAQVSATACGVFEFSLIPETPTATESTPPLIQQHPHIKSILHDEPPF